MSQNNKGEMLSSALKCFEVLETLNTFGTGSVPELTSRLKLSRTTATRILRTLQSRGYVSRDVANRYFLTIEVNRLSCGYSTETIPLADLRLALHQAAQSYMWPLQLVLPHENSMCTYLATDVLTPYKLFATSAGTHLPYAISAAGVMYLANCTSEERAIIFRNVPAEGDTKVIWWHETTNEIAVAQKNGYMIKKAWGGATAVARDASKGQLDIAVPLSVNGRTVACLTSRIMGATLAKNDLASSVYPRLSEIAASLSAIWETSTKPRLLRQAAE
jgi:DNA-binding IclR family transcriptional regulator